MATINRGYDETLIDIRFNYLQKHDLFKYR